MSASNAFENDIMLLLFNNTNIGNIGDATGLRGSTAAGSLYVALHTSDPGEAGNQSTSEAAYTGYARVAVARSAGGWTVAGNTISNTAIITFGTSTVGTPTITHFSVGYESAGATKMIVSNVLNTSQVINIGGANTWAAGALTATVD